MIRINLFEETRVQTKAKGGGRGLPKIQVAENVPVMILLGGLAAAVAGVLIAFMLQHTKLSGINEQITKAEKRRDQLKYVLERNDQLNAKKDDLNRKIGIIAGLKDKQDLPVQLLDLLSRNLADHVWFEEITYAGETVTIKGLAQTNIALSNQLRNLEESKYFLEVAMGTVTADAATGLTKFEMSAKFNPSGTPPAPPKPEGASGPAGKAPERT